jgi:hypothetical protein
MSVTGKHSRLTSGQRTLAGFIAILAIALTPVFFTVMYLAVTHLLAGSFGMWSWTVPIATEISFTLLFLLWVLLEWRDRAPGWLKFAPYPFAAASLWLNVYSSRGDLPGMVGHGVVTIAFFVPLLALKAAVTRLTVSDEDRQRKLATADAIAHARDILRAADRWWRFRAPLMLRRQLRTRRLPAAVTTAISQGVTFGGAAKWEPVVEAWITKSLALPEGVAAQLAAAREAASRPVPQAESGASSVTTPERAPEPASGQVPSVPEETSGASPKLAPRLALKLAPGRARSMSPDQLADHVEAMLEYGSVSVNRVKQDLHVATGKAQAALDIARRRRLSVVPPERKAAR